LPFEWFVAIRYLRDARGQSALMLAAVSVGVSVIVFLSALINGLQSSLIESTLGSQPHITLRIPREEPRALVYPRDGLAIARLRQPATQRLRSLDQWPAVMRAAARTPGVTGAAPTVSGSGTATRADARVPIVIRGVNPGSFLDIIDLQRDIVQGAFDVTSGRVVIGSSLAGDLGVSVGDRIRVTSTEGVEDVVMIAGLFTVGTDAVDKSWLVTSLRHGQSLFDLPGGVTTIELKVRDVFDADRIADGIRGRTGLTVESWMTLNAELLSGLSAQSSSKTMIQLFVVVSVALGIASILIVSVVQKSREIGILRAVGTPARRVLAVFLIQGGVLGVTGSFIGSAVGVLFAKLFELLTADPAGVPRFPVQVDPSLLLGTTLLATAVGLLAAVIPARRAAALDPAAAIHSG
jgi:lipoprotein-releasing system permease protein